MGTGFFVGHKHSSSPGAGGGEVPDQTRQRHEFIECADGGVGVPGEIEATEGPSEEIDEREVRRDVLAGLYRHGIMRKSVRG